MIMLPVATIVRKSPVRRASIRKIMVKKVSMKRKGGTATKTRTVAMKKRPPQASTPNRKIWPALKWQRSKAGSLTMKFTRPVSC